MSTFEYQITGFWCLWCKFFLADCKKKKYGMPGNDLKTLQSHTNLLHPHDLVTVTANYNFWQDQELSELATPYMYMA